MMRPDIDWYRALSVAEWAAESTAEQVLHAIKTQRLLTESLGTIFSGPLRIDGAAIQTLAHAYLNLLRENGDLRIALDEARGVAVEDEA